jgi:hypothetical protein
MTVTDLLIGVNKEKYRKRVNRLHRPEMTALKMLALEIHVREKLRARGVDPGAVDIDGQFLDHVDPRLSYYENKRMMDDRLSGRGCLV